MISGYPVAVLTIAVSGDCDPTSRSCCSRVMWGRCPVYPANAGNGVPNGLSAGTAASVRYFDTEWREFRGFPPGSQEDLRHIDPALDRNDKFTVADDTGPAGKAVVPGISSGREIAGIFRGLVVRRTPGRG